MLIDDLLPKARNRFISKTLTNIGDAYDKYIDQDFNNEAEEMEYLRSHLSGVSHMAMDAKDHLGLEGFID